MSNKLKQAAIDAMKHWLHPQSVPGTDLKLCYVGRIQRAMEKGSEAMRTGDTATLDKIKKAIRGLEDMAQAASKAASDAQRAYKDATGESVTVDPCTCEYCQKEQQLDMVWQAETRVRRAIFDLFEPIDGNMPKPLALLRSGNNEELQALMSAMWKAQDDYYEACKLFKFSPRWGDVVRTAL